MRPFLFLANNSASIIEKEAMIYETCNKRKAENGN
jgi:hypothetical protein